jgi:hypothetical protein
MLISLLRRLPLYVLALVFLCVPAQAQQVLFSDDFRGVSTRLPDGPTVLFPDQTKWAFTFWPGTVWPDSYGDGTNWLAGNADCQTYVTPLLRRVKGIWVSPTLRYNPFTITPEGLKITASLLDSQQMKAYKVESYRRFGSGMLLSRYNFKYGQIKMVAKLPSARGSWPALWLLPTSKTWPPEIDVFEGMVWGNRKTSISSGMLMTPADGPNLQTAKWFPIGVNPSLGFNEYRLDWTAQYIAVYFNGIKLWQQPTPASMKQSMYIIINFGVGGRWPFNELGVQPIDGMSSTRLNTAVDLIKSDYPDSMIIKSISVTKL